MPDLSGEEGASQEFKLCNEQTQECLGVKSLTCHIKTHHKLHLQIVISLAPGLWPCAELYILVASLTHLLIYSLPHSLPPSNS